MGKRRKKNHGEDGEAELWLVSYADMMTLLCCFFILMMAFAHYDPIGFTKKVEEVSKHFNKDKYKSSENNLRFLQEELVKHPEIKKKTKVTIHDGALFISFSGSVLFESGSVELSDNVIPVLDSMIDIFKTKDPNLRIIVEGHTDNQIMDPTGPFRSNWALSGARASSVINRFEKYGFLPSFMKVVAYGDTKPLVPNKDKHGKPILKNMEMNRRVIIKVIEPIQPVDKDVRVKLGLGVYFDDELSGSMDAEDREFK